MAASCMGFFLKGHRGFTKDRRVVELLQSTLSSSDLLLCRKALETLSALLSHFRSEADRESKAGAADFADSRDGRVAGTSQSGHALVQGASSQRSASAKAGSAAVEASSKTNSAIEAAQPLAAFADVVLSHITLAGSVGPAAGVPSPKKSHTKRGRSAPETEEEEEQGSSQDTEKAEGVLRVRVEALSVVRHLHQQGLVNPMAVLPKVFALTFAGDPRLSEPATAMLKEMLELRPSLSLRLHVCAVNAVKASGWCSLGSFRAGFSTAWMRPSGRLQRDSAGLVQGISALRRRLSWRSSRRRQLSVWARLGGQKGGRLMLQVFRGRGPPAAPGTGGRLHGALPKAAPRRHR